jgi:hypothetical protein
VSLTGDSTGCTPSTFVYALYKQPYYSFAGYITFNPASLNMYISANILAVGAYPLVITAYQTGNSNAQVSMPFVLFINPTGNTCV